MSSNNLIEFFETIKKDRYNRGRNKDQTNIGGVDIFETWDFEVVTKMNVPGRVVIQDPYKNRGISCITLDSEDMEYLYRKYRPKLEEELKNKKNELEHKYKEV